MIMYIAYEILRTCYIEKSNATAVTPEYFRQNRHDLFTLRLLQVYTNITFTL